MFRLRDAVVLRRHQENPSFSAVREGLGTMRQLFSVTFSGNMQERWAPGLIERRLSVLVTETLTTYDLGSLERNRRAELEQIHEQLVTHYGDATSPGNNCSDY